MKAFFDDLKASHLDKIVNESSSGSVSEGNGKSLVFLNNVLSASPYRSNSLIKGLAQKAIDDVFKNVFSKADPSNIEKEPLFSELKLVMRYYLRKPWTK